jgi:hypothetical protein
MPLQAPIVVVAENTATSLIAALTAGVRCPLVALRPAEARTQIGALAPAAVAVADPHPDAGLIDAIIDQVASIDGPFVPVIACRDDDHADILPIAADAPPRRWVARLSSALRVRTLHGTVLRRAAAGGTRPAESAGEPLEQATVMVIGRGGGYPALTMAVGEKVGLIGAFSFETAERYLETRDIDGIVIGDGFPSRAVEAFLDKAGADARSRDLPIVVADSRVGPLDFDLLPNADRVRGGPDRVRAHLLPLVRLHAFAAQLRRLARSLAAKGFVDAHTGLLSCDAFVRDLMRAVAEARKRKGSLSLARLSFGPVDRRASIDAARIVGRLTRATDFAALDDDGSIHVAFGDTDLKAAHVVARRIASVLKHTMLAPEADAPRLNPEVALVTRKSADTAETLLARVRPAAPIAAE